MEVKLDWPRATDKFELVGHPDVSKPLLHAAPEELGWVLVETAGAFAIAGRVSPKLPLITCPADSPPNDLSQEI